MDNLVLKLHLSLLYYVDQYIGLELSPIENKLYIEDTNDELLHNF